MYRFRVILFCVITIMIWTCQQGNPTAELEAEVMKIHDEVMPKVHDIHKLIKTLKEKLNEPDLDENQQELIQKGIEDLDAADKAMWDWMNAYEEPDDQLPAKEAIQFLNAEKEKISKVSDMMLESISAAQKLLK